MAIQQSEMTQLIKRQLDTIERQAQQIIDSHSPGARFSDLIPAGRGAPDNVRLAAFVLSYVDNARHTDPDDDRDAVSYLFLVLGQFVGQMRGKSAKEVLQEHCRENGRKATEKADPNRQAYRAEVQSLMDEGHPKAKAISSVMAKHLRLRLDKATAAGALPSRAVRTIQRYCKGL